MPLIPQWVQPALALLILAGAVWSFVRERISPDLTSLLALLALLLTGVLTPAEAFSGFSHPATVSVAAVLVLSAGLERTGALTFLARRVLAPVSRSEWLLTIAVMLVIGLVSAFINNTAAVAVFIPVVLQACRRSGIAAGRVLMPMAHAATFGGMCTLIGTSTNLVAHEYARSNGLPGFRMFEFANVGLPMALAGSLYIVFVGRWLLPRSAPPRHPVGRVRPYLSELVVPERSGWIGRVLRPDRFSRDHEVELVEVRRGDAVVPLDSRGARYQAGDHLRVRGPLEHVLALARREQFEVHGAESGPAASSEPDDAPGEAPPPPSAPQEPPARATGEGGPLPLTELVVLPNSQLVGRTLAGSRFSERFGASVLAIHRPGGAMEDRPIHTRLRAGDVLVVRGTDESLLALSATPGFVVAGRPVHYEERPEKLWIALVTLAGVVSSVSLGLLPIVTAASAGCAVLMLTGCLRPREAYQAIDWSIVFLLAGALALGLALDKTGVTSTLAGLLAGAGGTTTPWLVLAGFLLLSIVVSEFMSNSATVALLAPVAVSSAQQLGINPMALLAGITFGASAAFAMPIGYQTSLMVYGPGGYRFRDFARVGLPLDLMLGALALWLIPLYWPLRP